jgi:hypothetical protein
MEQGRFVTVSKKKPAPEPVEFRHHIHILFLEDGFSLFILGSRGGSLLVLIVLLGLSTLWKSTVSPIFGRRMLPTSTGSKSQ